MELWHWEGGELYWFSRFSGKEIIITEAFMLHFLFNKMSYSQKETHRSVSFPFSCEVVWRGYPHFSSLNLCCCFPPFICSVSTAYFKRQRLRFWKKSDKCVVSLCLMSSCLKMTYLNHHYNNLTEISFIKCFFFNAKLWNMFLAQVIGYYETLGYLLTSLS